MIEQAMPHEMPGPDAVQGDGASEAHARGGETTGAAPTHEDARAPDTSTHVAIIGMAGRFPGAPSVAALWRALLDKTDLATDLGDDLDEPLPERSAADAAFVRRAYMLDDIAGFDNALFGIAPDEAARLDPQHRLFLESCHEALEVSGHAPFDIEGTRVGVFGGANFNAYAHNLTDRPTLSDPVSTLDLMLGTDKDYLTSRVAYKLGLRGPALLISTACSTSLVAVASACQSLLTYQCDMALAGGVGLRIRPRTGYLGNADGFLSRDGRCRPFDAGASGFIEGSGVGVVVLKRLDDALADGDPIDAVIRGFAVNNDGADKVGFTAPSVSGQAEAIAEAMAMAGAGPEEIGYFEAHGTGTPMGDPIEVSAIERAWGVAEGARGRGLIGSVKGNVGHLGAAAGVTGLIKAVLATKTGTVPGTMHFERANPELTLDRVGLTVSPDTAPWPVEGTRLAAVSSFGIGGTNAHIVLGEAPRTAAATAPPTDWTVLPVSAATRGALDATAEAMRAAAAGDPASLRDLAFTLTTARSEHEHRAALLAHPNGRCRVAATGRAPSSRRRVAFVFPGTGPQFAGMADGLYATHDVFRGAIDRAHAFLAARYGVDLRGSLAEGHRGRGLVTELTMLVAVEIALAEQLKADGIVPDIVLGHSLGHYAACHVAGAMSAETALILVAERARLVDETPEGGMVAVAADAATVSALLHDGLWIACKNAAEATVVSGTRAAVDAFEQTLERGGYVHKRVQTDRAHHSPLLEAVEAPFAAIVAAQPIEATTIPVVGNAGAGVLEPHAVCATDHFTRHMVETVDFAGGVETLSSAGDPLIIEVGPGRTLANLIETHEALEGRSPVLQTLRGANDVETDSYYYAGLKGALWAHGGPKDALAAANAAGRRIPAPTYHFDRMRHWIDIAGNRPAAKSAPARQPMDAWFYRHGFVPRTCPVPVATGLDARHLLVLADPADPFSGALCDRLAAAGASAHHHSMFEALPALSSYSDVVVVQAPLTDGAPDAFDAARSGGFDPAVAVLNGLATATGHRCARMSLVAPDLFKVVASDAPVAELAPLVALARTAPFEFPDLALSLIDSGSRSEAAAEAVCADILNHGSLPLTVTAHRLGHVWDEAVVPDTTAPRPVVVREDGVFLVIGGFGGIGQAIAADLARRAPHARIVLAGRTLPDGPTPAENAAADAGATTFRELLDAGDPAAVARLVADIMARFGRIDGIVMAAGVLGEGLIEAGLPEGSRSNIGPKVRGLTAVETALAGQPVDFLLMASSIGVVTGNVGQLDNLIGNAFMDAFAEAGRLPSCRHVMAVDWDYWLGTGVVRKLAERHRRVTGEEIDEGIRPEDVAACLDRVFATGAPRLLVSTRPLPQLVAERLARRHELLTRMAAADQPADTATSGDRPDLATAFAAPRTDLEWCLCALWQDSLGVAPVGIDDPYTALGGHSLKAMSLIGVIRNVFACELSMRAFFESGTVRRLAEVLTSTDGAAEIESLAAELRGDSADREVAA